MKTFKTIREVGDGNFSNEIFITIVCGCSHRRKKTWIENACLDLKAYFIRALDFVSMSFVKYFFGAV